MGKSNQKKLIKKKQKPNFITGLKELTNYIVYSNKKLETLEKIIETYKFDDYIYKRLLSYIYSYPHLIYYWNKYLNNIYDWNILFGSKLNKQQNIIKLIESFKFTLMKNNCNDKSKFMYIKSDLYQDKNRNSIKKLLKNYFKTINGKTYNEIELNFFYDLFLLNVISDVDLMKIDQLLNDGKSTIKIETFSKPIIQNENVIETQNNVSFEEKTFSEKIQSFINNVKNYKKERKQCRNCGLFNSKIVVLDTNINDIKPVDIAFFGLNPGKTESEKDLPFVGVSGKKLREKISLLPNNISWIISNIIMCYTNNEKEIPKEAYMNCQEMFKNMCEAFPAKYYVFFGNSASKLAGINESITKASGKIYNNKIIPIIHPSSLRSEKMINIWNKSFETVFNLFKSNENINVRNFNTNDTNDTFYKNIPKNKIITNITEDLTFFDVKQLQNNKIVKIFIDKNGEKKYLFEDYFLTLNVKNSNFKDCNMISDSVDYVVKYKGSNKYYISKLLHDQLEQIKNV